MKYVNIVRGLLSGYKTYLAVAAVIIIAALEAVDIYTVPVQLYQFLPH